MARGVVCEVTPIGLLAYFVEVFSLTLQSFFSHRTHRFNRPFLRTVSNPQNASGIQNSQNVTAIVDTNKEAKSSLHPAHMGISVITPLPSGGGVGGGASNLLGISVITPLPFGGGDGGGANCDIVLSRYSFLLPFSLLHPFTLCQYFYSS